MQTLSGPSLHSVTRQVLLVPSCSLTAEASFLWPLTLCVHTLQSRGLVAMSGQFGAYSGEMFPRCRNGGVSRYITLLILQNYNS